VFVVSAVAAAAIVDWARLGWETLALGCEGSEDLEDPRCSPDCLEHQFWVYLKADELNEWSA
jgi:hypothetical protein